MYSFIILFDDNNNGIFGSGNLDKNIVPETILFHPLKINLKPNWEITDLKFTF
jgi:hypothetical protein